MRPGSVFVAGRTSSSNFPTQNAYDTDFNGGNDVFVSKLTPSGDALVYSTYLGGMNDDTGCGVAVDAVGSAYLTGYTYSPNFPVQSAYDPDPNGGYDAFVSKISESGNALAYSTYLGGSDFDLGECIAIDGSGSAYVAGLTYSADFPTQNAYDASFNGIFAYDAFVSKVSASGNSLDYSTYLGGSDYDEGYGIAVDGSGSAYVTGNTVSSDFPTQNAYVDTLSGGSDAFISKFSASGNELVYSTYLGGSGGDYGSGIAVDASGSAFLTGRTSSSDFPIQLPFDVSFDGGIYAFVSKLSTTGNALIYSTYLGGSSADDGDGIALDAAGLAYVTGGTRSSDFPIQNAFVDTLSGSYDVFVSKLSFDFSVDVDDIGDRPSLPDGAVLYQNYPNPFNPSTTIHYYVPKSSHVSIEVCNLLGQKVSSLLDEWQASGPHETVWEGTDYRGRRVASGVYFYRLRFGQQIETRKMILLK